MRVAIVHDYLNQMGGAERVLEVLHELFPDAPVYTSIYWPQAMSPAIRRMDVRVSFMQRLPFVLRHHQPFLPLYPLAFEQFNLSGYDLVLSMSSAWSKGVITRPETFHVNYCLTPMRFAWSYYDYIAREELSGVALLVLPLVISYLRLWDVVSAQRVDRFIAISHTVARRIEKYYRRRPAVIYPPVNTAHFSPSDGYDDYFLVVGRLIPYKRTDLAVRACTRLRLPLKVIGDGRDRQKLQRMAGPTVEFLGRLSDEETRRYLARCRALIFPGEEDFGITPVEAMASGRPVIAFAGGGALETVVEGVTGCFFTEPTVDSLAAVLAGFDPARFDPRAIAAHAAQFHTEVFKQKLRSFLDQEYTAFRRGELASDRVDDPAGGPREHSRAGATGTAV
jgi:glycosyltransferase involved in cell wall biosynthesis